MMTLLAVSVASTLGGMLVGGGAVAHYYIRGRAFQ